MAIGEERKEILAYTHTHMYEETKSAVGSEAGQGVAGEVGAMVLLGRSCSTFSLSGGRGMAGGLIRGLP